MKRVRRSRKDEDQIEILKLHFEKNPNWSKRKIESLARVTGLTEAQVYKWNWDKGLKQRSNSYSN